MLTPGTSFRNELEGWQDCVAETCDPEDGGRRACTGPHNFHNRVHLWVAGEYTLAHQAVATLILMALLWRPRSRPQSRRATTTRQAVWTMAANCSLNDPVFWLHHSNIDRLWNVWMSRHGRQYLPISGGLLGHNINDPMWPYHHIGMMVTPATSSIRVPSATATTPSGYRTKDDLDSPPIAVA